MQADLDLHCPQNQTLVANGRIRVEIFEIAKSWLTNYFKRENEKPSSFDYPMGGVRRRSLHYLLHPMEKVMIIYVAVEWKRFFVFLFEKGNNSIKKDAISRYVWKNRHSSVHVCTCKIFYDTFLQISILVSPSASELKLGILSVSSSWWRENSKKVLFFSFFVLTSNMKYLLYMWRSTYYWRFYLWTRNFNIYRVLL